MMIIMWEVGFLALSSSPRKGPVPSTVPGAQALICQDRNPRV